MEIPLEDMGDVIVLTGLQPPREVPERSGRTRTSVQTGRQGWGKAQDSFLLPPRRGRLGGGVERSISLPIP